MNDHHVGAATDRRRSGALLGRTVRGLSRPARAGLVVIVVGLVAATTGFTIAAFSATTSNSNNSFTTGTVLPPSGFNVTETCGGAATNISFRSASSAKGKDSLTIPTPSGVTNGDVMVAQISNRNGLPTLVAPLGWNLVRRETNANVIATAIFWKAVGAAELGSATFSLVGTLDEHMAGGIVAYRGADTTNPVHASGTSAGYSTTATTPSVTTTSANTMLFQTIAKRQEVMPAPGGTTSRWAVSSGPGANSLGATAGDETFGGPGASPSRSSSTDFSSEWVAHTVALRRVASTPTATASWTASPSSWASGYKLERVVGGSVENTKTITPISATSTTDGPLTNDTAYTFRLYAYYGNWKSTVVTDTLTPSC